MANPSDDIVKNRTATRGRYLGVLASFICAVVAGTAGRYVFGPDWINFVGAALVAIGGFLLVLDASRLGKSFDALGLAVIAMGGGLVMVGAYPQ